MKIGLFADAHCSTKAESCRTRRPSLSFDKIRAAMEAFADADLVICLGDLMDDCENPQDNPAMLEKIGELIASFNVPFCCLRGNHDCDMFSEADFYAGIDSSPPKVLKYDDCGLIFLDANYDACGRAYAAAAVDWTDTALPEDQIQALREALEDSEIQRAYIFIHQNLDPNVQHQHIVANAAQVRRILEDSGKVRRVIQGHYHPGCDSVIGGIEYHTLPAMCEGERNYYEIMEI